MNNHAKRIQKPGYFPVSMLAPVRPHTFMHHVWIAVPVLFVLIACTATFNASTTAAPTTELLPTALLPSPTPSEWTRQQFGDVWDIEYPADWAVNDSGIHEASLVLGGYYGGHTYEITLDYPIFVHLEAMQSLDAWVGDELALLSPEQRDAVQVLDIYVAGAPAKKVLNMPEKIYDDGATRRYGERLTHACYIWRRDEKSPSVIRIKQVDLQAFDASQMEKLLQRFLAGIR